MFSVNAPTPIAPKEFNQENLSDSKSAWHSLDVLLKEPSFAASLSKTQAETLRTLGQEADPEIFFQTILSTASRLEASHKTDSAGLLYSLVAKEGQAENSVSTFAEEAKKRLGAIQGGAAFGARFEVLLRRFAEESTDGKIILPMMAGSTIYALGRTAMLGRLAANTTGAWYARGAAARLLSSSAGFALEVPTFTLAARGLRQLGDTPHRSELGLGDEMIGSATTLGLLKFSGFAGNQAFLKLHGVNELGAAARLTGLTSFTQPLARQSSMFFGLVAAHKLEEKRLGLAPVDNDVMVTDTLATMASLGVGSHLGSRVLGRSYARLHAELGLRADVYTKFAEAKPQQNRHPLQSPWLAPAMMMLGAGGLGGGGPSGKSRRPKSGEPSTKVLIPQALKNEIASIVEQQKNSIPKFAVLSDGTIKHPPPADNGKRLTQGVKAILKASQEHSTETQIGYPFSTLDSQGMSERLRQSSRKRVEDFWDVEELTLLAKLGELGAVESLARRAKSELPVLRSLREIASEVASYDPKYLRWAARPEQPLPIQTRVAAYRALQKISDPSKPTPGNYDLIMFEALMQLRANADSTAKAENPKIRGTWGYIGLHRSEVVASLESRASARTGMSEPESANQAQPTYYKFKVHHGRLPKGGIEEFLKSEVTLDLVPVYKEELPKTRNEARMLSTFQLNAKDALEADLIEIRGNEYVQTPVALDHYLIVNH